MKRTTDGGKQNLPGENTGHLLLLASTKGYETRLFAETARRLGFPLVLATDRCHQLDDPWRDGALAVRFEDPEGAARLMAERARRTPIKGIVALGDRAVRTAAAAGAALGLPGHPPAAAEACRDKFRARQRLQAAGVWVPPFARFSLEEDPRPRLGELPFPCVLKPLSLSAGQGVLRADTPEEFLAAFERLRALLRRPNLQVLREESLPWILVEGYIPGAEVALEGLLDHGRLRVLALFDKPGQADGPTFEETMLVTPSRLPVSAREEVAREVERAARALGLYHGPLHAELRLAPEEPRILEVAARSIGGLCARVLRFHAGMDLPELILRHGCGLPVDPTPEGKAAGVLMVPVPQAGLYEGVDGVEGARATPGMEDVVITAKEGHPVEPLPEGSSYLGFLFARAGSPEEVEQALRAAQSHLRFRLAPRLPVAD